MESVAQSNMTPQNVEATQDTYEKTAEESTEKEKDKVSEKFAKILRGVIKNELHDWQYYKILSKRAPSQAAGKVLSQLAADELAHAREFLVALFYITGIKEEPKDPILPKITIPPYSLALRERIMEERAANAKYTELARVMEKDESLRELFLKTAGDEARHATQLQALMEG